MDQGADSRSRDEVLGPPLCRIYELSPSGRSRRMRPLRHLSGFSPTAHQ